MLNGTALFVVDTHALWWYLRFPERLSPAASAIFQLAKTGNATIIVPAIAVAELYFLSVKMRQPFVPSDLLDALASVGGIELSPLGSAQLKEMDTLHEVPEMHDRLIAAESFVHNAPVVTRDEALARSPRVQTIW